MSEEFSAFGQKHHIQLPEGYAQAAADGQRPQIKNKFLSEDDAGANLRSLSRQGDVSYLGARMNADGDIEHCTIWKSQFNQ